jgi:hypothetical protein
MGKTLSPLSMNSSPIRKLVIAGSLTLLLVACKSPQEKIMERAMESDNGGDADVNMNRDGSMHIENDAGTYDTGTSIPKDWPEDVSVYDNATIQYSASVNPKTGKPGSMLVIMTTDSIADLGNFYKGDLAANGWEMEGMIEGGGMTILGGTKDNRQVSVMISGADGQTSVTLAVGEKE